MSSNTVCRVIKTSRERNKRKEVWHHGTLYHSITIWVITERHNIKSVLMELNSVHRGESAGSSMRLYKLLLWLSFNTSAKHPYIITTDFTEHHTDRFAWQEQCCSACGNSFVTSLMDLWKLFSFWESNSDQVIRVISDQDGGFKISIKEWLENLMVWVWNFLASKGSEGIIPEAAYGW